MPITPPRQLLASISSGLSSVFRVNKEHQDELGAVLTLATGEAATSEVRIENWNGKDYTVVPVVAIVEGVLQGANAKGPEFAAADEFGKFPKSWDGRPVVMNHPQMNGMFVSAAIPKVLEDFGMGTIFNSRVEDKKLKCEAWLDHVRIEELGGEMLSTLERIRANETVEVSVGAWLDVVSRPGSYGGKRYDGVWSNVAPDHLAFLSAGVKGACSIADGCGVPRLFSINVAAIDTAASCCEECSKGEPCTAKKSDTTDDPPVDPDAPEDEKTKKQKMYRAEALKEMLTVMEPFSLEPTDFGIDVNSIPQDMAIDDIEQVVNQALGELLNMPTYNFVVMAITSNLAVYYVWGDTGFKARNIVVDADGNVKFSADETAVNLLTRIVPRQVTEPLVNEQETKMPGEQTGTGAPAATVTTETGAGTAPGQTPVVEAAPKPPTFSELLAAADPDVRETIESGIEVNKARRAELIEGLVACKGCEFTKEELEDQKVFSLKMLERMAKMANVANFSGRALPTGQPGIGENSNEPKQKTMAINNNFLGGDEAPEAAAA